MGASATARLVGLVALTLAFPVFPYLYFERAYDDRRTLFDMALAERDSAIAQSFAPLLQANQLSEEAVRATLAQFSSDNIRRWLLHTPIDVRNSRGIQIAALSSWFPRQAETPLDEKIRLEAISQLPDSCSPDGPGSLQGFARRATSAISVIPIVAVHGCWLLVSMVLKPGVTTNFPNRRFWQTPELQLAAALYLLLSVTTLLCARSFVQDLKRFCGVAYDIGQHRTIIPEGSAQIVIKELSGAAEVIDGFALDIQRISLQIHQAAGDNAHSLKTPLAVLRAAVARVRRNSADDQEQVHRALNAADQALDRLFLLVTASQKLDEDNAALVVAPRQLIKVNRLIADACIQFQDMLTHRNIRLVCRLDDEVVVRAGADNLETVLRNTIDNAISASPDGSTIFITLKRDINFIWLQIDDAGSGIAPDDIDRVFARDFSTHWTEGRQGEERHAKHVRPGLFVVKRNIEALGGQVVARASSTGALSVIIKLPRPRR
jgi:two-component system sensor histidine kinase ChvG